MPFHLFFLNCDSPARPRCASGTRRPWFASTTGWPVHICKGCVHRASKIMTDLPSYTFPEVIHQSWKNCSKFKLVVHDVLRDIWRANHPSWQYICWNDTENRYKLPPHLLLGLIPKQFTSLSHKCIDQGSSGKTLYRFPQTV